ncbi:MAG TPA: molybdate ABC transporter substrate-binding protein [Nitrospirales bacterium]|nr:molybdate ABC transporter substrate-binding protein [Nitrospirales bacterium]
MQNVIGIFSLLITLLGSVGLSHAAEVTIAVASNFRAAVEVIADEFEARTTHHVVISSASTGKLYAQITHGAPFEVLLAADTKHPQLLIDESFAVKNTAFTYAVGRLALWTPNPDHVIDGLHALRRDGIRHIAMANPKTAPYGQATYEVLSGAGLWLPIQAQIVRGENIGQAFQFVASGNADLGFVALSQVLNPRNRHPGSRWDVPRHLHAPLQQAAVLLRKGQSHEPAKAFLRFLREPFSQKVIQRFGYGLNN